MIHNIKAIRFGLDSDPKGPFPPSNRVPVRWVVKQSRSLKNRAPLGREVPGSTSVKPPSAELLNGTPPKSRSWLVLIIVKVLLRILKLLWQS
jgi:hypothetical protein